MEYNDSKTRARNRKKIVDVAKKLFIENGIAHTTVMDIVREVEMERKTFYNYFESKDEIADYIYYQTIQKYYSTGFKKEDYTGFTNGYEKVEAYFKTLVDAFVDYKEETLYLVHYDYFSRKQPDSTLIESIYKESNVADPYSIFLEGINDGTINVGELNPEEIFQTISQSIGAFAFRLIFRSYKNGYNGEENYIPFEQLYDLVQIHLRAIKNY